MANKELVFQNVARDLTGGQFFAIKLIDGGTAYTMYLEELTQPPRQPAVASQITATGVPIIAPSGAGDVIGIGTTNTLPLWTDGPNSVIGDSLLSQSGGNVVQASGNFVLAAAGLITFPDNVRQVFNPGATVPGINVGAIAGDPSTPINGDLWYDSTGNLLRARINGGSVSLTGPTVPFNLTGVSATGFTVAAAGTDYQLQVDTSIASAVTGIKVTGRAAGSGVDVTAISSGTNEGIQIAGKGTYLVKVGLWYFNSLGEMGTIAASATSLGNNAAFYQDTNVTVLNSAANLISFRSVNVEKMRLIAAGLVINSGAGFRFSDGTSDGGTVDSAFSRISAGLVGVGTGAAGSFAGSLKLTDLIIGTTGGGLDVKEGSDATMGTGVLNGTTEVTITTNKVTANSRIFLSIQAPGGTPLGVIYVSSRSAGVSFGVKGAATDASTFAWWIVEPAA